MPKINKKLSALQKKLKKSFNLAKENTAVRGILVAAFLFFVSFTIYNLLFWGRIFPGILVSGIDVGTKKPTEAEVFLSQSLNIPEKIEVAGDNQTFLIELSNIEASYNFSKSAYAAYNLYRTGNIFYDLPKRLVSPISPQNIGLRVDINEDKLKKNLSVIAGQVAVEPVKPSLTIAGNSVVADKGKPGIEIDREKLRADIGYSLSYLAKDTVNIKTVEVDPTLTDEELEEYQKRGKSLLGKKLTINFENNSFTYQGQGLFDLLSGNSGYDDEKLAKLADEVAASIEREPQNPVFVFETGRVKEFAPSKDGIALKKDSLIEKIKGNIRTLETSEDKFTSIDAPVEVTEPEIKTEEVNNLGINELIGRGDSTYRGSISSRVHNIGVASSRFNGALIEPGEVFSFNEILGDVSEYTGYKQAYIIQDGKTVLGDGGGVCQVSTTMFRAALDAGFPIIERRSHSYRVGYYEQDSPPGLDATIYTPITDLKFRNDTPGHILIQTIYEPSRLYLAFEIYGTDDGRIANTTKPIVTDVTPPPEDRYEDDPSLPAGEIKQIEYKAWGAKARFTYTVKKAGEITFEKTFYSNYQPWGAVYLRGTGPATQ